MNNITVQSHGSFFERILRWVRILIARNNQRLYRVIRNNHRRLFRVIMQRVQLLLTKEDRQLAAQLQEFVGQNVEITTAFGTVQGELVSVGEDFAEIREPSGNIVLIPFENFVFINPV
ncbi:hypothetical protein ACFOUO_14270 [Salinithrix halophila]|uniref:DUF2642 domain-containing protein n=1 Tax=Salinithrix halophila TaxID=1485204 RepID=A0ABV8JKV3_9BACL